MAIATSTVIAAAALATTAVATYQQAKARGDAADAREEAQEISGAQQQVSQRRATRQQVREERIRRARIMQASENTGVAASSSQFGATAALGTLAASNRAAGQGATRASQGISRANQSALDFQNQASIWGGVGQLGSQAFGASGGFGTIFSGTSGGGTGSPIEGGFSTQVFTGN